jgi:antitoxin component YwqK of YwqJK toxin-antitoxin module
VGAPQGLTNGGFAAWRASGLAIALALVSGADAFAQAFSVAASCRDGAPNGAYELRMPDGRLRVLGAFAKGRRTGTFLFWASTGSRIAVIPYDDDAKVGTVALWYPPAIPLDEPRRKLQSAYSAGVLHGHTRSWHANGKRRAEYRYERGELAAAQAWTERGEPMPEPEARRLAERDSATNAEFYASLELTIAANVPRCD